jgi:hypothetical protein
VDEILELRAQLAGKDRQLAEKDRQLARKNDVIVIANYKNHARQIVELGDSDQEVDNVELSPSQSAAAQAGRLFIISPSHCIWCWYSHRGILVPSTLHYVVAGSSGTKAVVAEQHTPAESTQHALHAAAVPVTSVAAAPASNDLRPESDITSGAGAAAGTANSAQQQQQHRQQWEQQQQQQQQQQQPPQQQQQQQHERRVLGKGKGRARDTTAAAAAASTPVAVQLSDSNISSDTESDVMHTPRAAKRARTVKDDKAVKHSTDLTVTIAAFRQRLPADIHGIHHLGLGSLIAHKGIDAQGKAKHRSHQEQTALYDSFFDLVNNSSSVNSSSSSGSSSSSRRKVSLRSLQVDETFISSRLVNKLILPRIFTKFPELKALSMTWCYAANSAPILPIQCKDEAVIDTVKQGLAKLTQLRCSTDSIGVVRTVLTDCVSLEGLHLMGVQWRQGKVGDLLNLIST